MRLEGGERIVRDLRTRRGYSRDKSRLAGVWKTHQTDIREQLQFQLKVQLFSLTSALMVARCSISRGSEVRVSETTTATARSEPAVAIVTEVVKKIACCSIKDLCAYGHAYNQVVAVAAGTIRALAVRATIRDVLRVIAQMQQRVQRCISKQNNVATAATIATRWTTTRHKLLAPK